MIRLLLGFVLTSSVLLPKMAQARKQGTSKQTSPTSEAEVPWDEQTVPYVVGGAIGTLGPYLVCSAAITNSGGHPGFVMCPGFGVGQAIQGRFLQTGWIFMIAEPLLGLGVLSETFGHGGRGDSRLFTGLYFVFRAFEILDLWVTPPALKAYKTGLTGASLVPIQGGAIGSVAFRFN